MQIKPIYISSLCSVCAPSYKFNFNFSDKTFSAYLNPNDIEPWNKPMWTVENETRTSFTCFATTQGQFRENRV
jgi:hypothetical protein